MAKSSSDVIEINVGGVHFATTRGTLSAHPDSMLSRLVDGNIPSAKDSNGRFFIDRDPQYFGVLLNFLRTGELYLPDGVPMKRVMLEGDFYGIGLNKVVAEGKKRRARKNSSANEPKKLAETLRTTTMETWKQYAESRYYQLVPIIMERLQAQTKTHPFFEAELALNMDTSGRESEEPQKFIRVMAQYNESLSSFLVHVPLKFVGQPICEIWSELLAKEGFQVSYHKKTKTQGNTWSIILSWASGYSKKLMSD